MVSYKNLESSNSCAKSMDIFKSKQLVDVMVQFFPVHLQKLHRRINTKPRFYYTTLTGTIPRGTKYNYSLWPLT